MYKFIVVIFHNHYEAYVKSTFATNENYTSDEWYKLLKLQDEKVQVCDFKQSQPVQSFTIE